MKTIELIPTEFVNFKQVAKKFKISYSSLVKRGKIIVEADINDLQLIGY